MDAKYGCHNTPRKPSYVGFNGVLGMHYRYVLVPVEIPDTMSRECRYDKKSTDARCEGCEK